LLHIDVWGPYRVAGLDKTLYIYQATDDATRFSWGERLISRADLANTVIRVDKRIETTHNVKIRGYRCDFEFSNRKVLDAWIEKENKFFEATVPYSHHQNGVGERAFRTDRDKVAPMMQELALPKVVSRIISGRGDELMSETTQIEKLWPEAYEHAIWLKNRSPTRALKNKVTPWESVYGHQPNLDREKIWGSRAYVTVPPELQMRQSKLTSPRAWLGYFVGCESESVYRIWNPEKKKVLRISTARIDDGNGLDDPHPEGNPAPSRGAPDNNRPTQDDESESSPSDADQSDGADSADEGGQLPADDGEELFVGMVVDEHDDDFRVSSSWGGDPSGIPVLSTLADDSVLSSALIRYPPQYPPEPKDDDSDESADDEWELFVGMTGATRPAPDKCQNCFNKVRTCEGGPWGRMHRANGEL
jgi:hypothetical protein